MFSVMRERQSARVPFDPERRVDARELVRILDAARWAPTAHNMQNYEIVAVDDPGVLAELGAIESHVTRAFLDENRKQAFSRDELIARGRGVLAEQFPPAWLDPRVDVDALPASHLRDALRGAPLLLVVAYDPRERAPASEGDALGIMSLGCVLENMWLAATAEGLAFQMLSTVASERVAPAVKRVLGIPEPLAIAFGARVGVPVVPAQPLRVRRDLPDFTHHNRYHLRSS